MRETLLHPGYFGAVDQFCVFHSAQSLLWENEDNYQKQTYRNRQYIYGANGKLLLNIPVKHSHNKEGRQLYKEVKIENEFNWQKNHWKSLESAYRTSPFFEFYEDELRHLYEKRFTYLINFNYRCIEAVKECLQIEKSCKKTTEYFRSYPDHTKTQDYRFLIKAKRQPEVALEPYPQVFQEKKGFIANLSILDLLFNEGPQALSYLEKHAKKTD